MTAQNFENVFQKLSLSMGIQEAFAGTEVRRLTIHKKERSVSMEISAKELIPLQKREDLRQELLKSLGLRKFGITFVSCPTCGRTEIDLISIANEVEEKCKNIDKDIKVAVMGCVVNGPGEAREADLGIAGGKGVGLVFKKGEVIRKVNEDELVSALMEEIEKA